MSFKRSDGFSLVSLTIALALGVGVLILAVQVFSLSRSAEHKAEIKLQLESSHMISESVLRSHKNIKIILKIGEVSGTAGYDADIPSTNTSLRDCLKKVGVACDSTYVSAGPASDGWQLLPDLVDKNGVKFILNGNYSRLLSSCNRADPGCDIEKGAKYKVRCSSPSSCEEIELKLMDAYVGDKSFFRAGTSIESRLFFRNEELYATMHTNYACAKSGAIVTNVSDDGKTAYCDDLQGMSSCDGSVLQSLAAGFTQNSDFCSENVESECAPTDNTSYTPRNFSFAQVGPTAALTICQTAPGSVATTLSATTLYLVTLRIEENFKRVDDLGVAQTAVFDNFQSVFVEIPASGLPPAGKQVTFSHFTRAKNSSTGAFPAVCLGTIDALPAIKSADLKINPDMSLSLLSVDVGARDLQLSTATLPNQGATQTFYIDPAYCK